jgi:hypothetical protein
VNDQVSGATMSSFCWKYSREDAKAQRAVFFAPLRLLREFFFQHAEIVPQKLNNKSIK